MHTAVASAVEAWPLRRWGWLSYFGDRRLGVADIIGARRRTDELNLLMRECLIEHLGEAYLATASGRILLGLYHLTRDEDGAFTTTEMRRRYAVARRMDKDKLESALNALVAQGIVKRRDSARTTQWELTGR